MAFRTNSDRVKEELGDDYGAKVDGKQPNLTPHIRKANVLVNRIAVLAAAGSGLTVLGDISEDTDALLCVESLLAAHFYTAQDKPLASKSTGGGSGSFQGQTGMGLQSTRYGQDAITTDYSRILAAIDKGAFASAGWMGKTLDEQLNYSERMGNDDGA